MAIINVFGSRDNIITIDTGDTVGVNKTIAFSRGENVNIVIDCGENITGWALSGVIKATRESAGSPTITDTTAGGGIVLSDATRGLARWDIPTGDSDNLTAGQWFWEVWRTDSGYESRLAYGILDVLPQVLHNP